MYLQLCVSFDFSSLLFVKVISILFIVVACTEPAVANHSGLCGGIVDNPCKAAVLAIAVDGLVSMEAFNKVVVPGWSLLAAVKK